MRTVETYSNVCTKCKEEMDFKMGDGNGKTHVEQWECYDCKIVHVMYFKFDKMEVGKYE